ncbi:MAG TPA: aminotransferase class V-fold PLP-dependent enzyme [Thermomicrobiaceae bacterium]|nr:aminotransferase class V-fold PLP-dependent enzyme [Thermomicrobiaceae bacterium]
MGAVETQSKSQMIREQMPATLKYAYLNTGTFGPLPRASIEAMQAYQQDELAEGRIGSAGYQRGFEARNMARAEVAKIFNCPPDNVALTRHTTDGMNIGILGLNWQPGDELIISDMEHPGGQIPAYNVARRYGVTLRLARLGDGTGDVVGKIERLISRRTRMIVVSHLTWNTGTVLPLADIVAMAHRHHVLVVADAAQSAASVPVDLPAMGIDVYGAPGQKWMCGPEGTGATYVSDEALDVIQPTVVGYMSMAGHGMETAGGYFLPGPGAHRFEVGGANGPAMLGQAKSVNFINETVGLDWAYRRIVQLGQYAWDGLSKIDGVTMITPKDQMAGLTCFNLAGIEPPALVEKLVEHGVVIRYIGTPLCARVSTGFYNTEEDVDRLVAGVEEIKRSL